MRVNFILPEAGLAGGVRVVAIYAERLSRRGHQVTVISLPRARPSTRQRASALLKSGRWLGHDSHKSHLDGLNIDHRVLSQRRPVEDRDVPDADVTIATWWETAEWVWKLSACKGRKVYLCQHDETHLDPRRDRVDATYALPMLQICVSRWIADEIKARHPRSRQVIVPNSVDAGFFRRIHRASTSTLTVGFMYSTLPSKGSDVAIAAIQRAREQGAELKVLSFGHAAPPPGIFADEDHFEAGPSQERIAQIYRSCDVWLFTSRVEGFGLPILEAMACGTPVIATPAGAAPQLLAGGGGMLVPLEDVTRVADAILRFCYMSEPGRARLSEAAHRTANGYTWDQATDRFECAILPIFASSPNDAAPSLAAHFCSAPASL